MKVKVQSRPVLGDPAAWSFPAPTSTTVGEGLVMHHLHLPGRGLVAVDLHLDAPVSLDPAGREGVAVITAHALDEGTRTRDANDFAAALDRVGADLRAGAGTSGMRVSIDVPATNLAPALELLAEAATEPVFPAREVERLVGQQLDAIRQQLARADERIGIVEREVMVGDHRCSRPNGGTLQTVDGIDRDMVAAFHADNVLGGPARLVVAGDLGAANLEQVAADRLGPFLSPGRTAHPVASLPVRSGAKVVVVDKPDAVQTELLVARPGPDRHAADWAPSQVAAYVLGGTLTSRLDMVLREEKGYTYGIRSRLTTYRRGGIAQLVAGSVDTEHTGESVRLALGIIARLVEDGPTADEVTAAVDYLAGVRPLTLETPRALTSEISRNLGDDLAADHTDIELAALRDVTLEQVASAAATHLPWQDATVIAVGDADAIVGDLEALDHADVEVHRD